MSSAYPVINQHKLSCSLCHDWYIAFHRSSEDCAKWIHIYPFNGIETRVNKIIMAAAEYLKRWLVCTWHNPSLRAVMQKVKKNLNLKNLSVFIYPTLPHIGLSNKKCRKKYFKWPEFIENLNYM